MFPNQKLEHHSSYITPTFSISNRFKILTYVYLIRSTNIFFLPLKLGMCLIPSLYNLAKAFPYLPHVM